MDTQERKDALISPINAMSWYEQDSPTSPDNQPNQFTPPTESGPQFSPENEKERGKGFRGWLNKYGSSVILPIIALLILAGGIYLYANQKNQEETSSTEEPGISLQEGEEVNFEISGEEELPETITTQPDQVVTEIIPEDRQENGMIVEKAVQGNGVTHLARQALKDYLKDNPQELTNEHKIYIEDYLKDKIGSKPLSVGEEISFSEDLIREAIGASQGLSASQLKTLEKYSATVNWL